MFITSSEHLQYKPLGHGGITFLKIGVTDQVICVIGQNGSGKSSILRLLNPQPATSTDFEKEGSTKLIIEHEGSTYEVGSDFTRPKGAHFFIKDGEELNESGTTGTQQQLATLHFGYTNLIKDITSGNVHICELSKAERKKLLLACYPTDLSFILQHHKNICTKVRAAKSNLKMLHMNKLEIEDNMIGDDEYKQLTGLIEHINDFRFDVDKWVHILNNEIDTWKRHEAFTSRIGMNNHIDHDAVRQQARILHNQATLRRLTKPHIFEDNTKGKIELVTMELTHNHHQVSELTTQANELTTEIDEFETLANVNVSDELGQLDGEYGNLEEEIRNLDIDHTVDVLEVGTWENFDLQELNVLLGAIVTAECDIWSSEKLNHARHEINVKRNSLAVLEGDHRRSDQNETRLAARYSREQGSGYNPACALPCQLKSNFNRVVSDLKIELDTCRATKQTTADTMRSLQAEIDKTLIDMEGPIQCEKIVEKIEMIFYRNDWLKLTLKRKHLVQVLIESPMNILNAANKLIDNTRKVKQSDQLNERMKNIEYRRKVLRDTKVPTKEFICKSLISKKANLEMVTEKYGNHKDKVQELNRTLDDLRSIDGISDQVIALTNDTINKSNFLMIQGKLDMLNGMVCDLITYRKIVDEKQVEIKAIVKDQASLRIRLNDEIEPNVIRQEKWLTKLQHIESALSPNGGFPHIYMTRFVNSIILAANEYIRIVWEYDMRILPLKETGTLDFTFKVKINNNGTVKDVSICSKAQKMVINLAWTLALYNQMNLKGYPLLLDEPDDGMSAGHRTNLLTLLNTLLRQGDVKQLFLVNHFNSLFTAFANSQIVCLNEQGIAVPKEYNQTVEIK